MTTYVLDASVLIGFARARRLEVLADVLRDEQVKTTPEVLDEVRNKASVYPEVESALALPWIETVQVSGLKAMGVYAEYAKRVGSSTTGNVGEATVLAWAECHGATAVIDEKVGRDAAKSAESCSKAASGLSPMGSSAGFCRCHKRPNSSTSSRRRVHIYRAAGKNSPRGPTSAGCSAPRSDPTSAHPSTERRGQPPSREHRRSLDGQRHSRCSGRRGRRVTRRCY